VTSDNPRTEDPDEIVKEILTGVTGNAKCIVKVNRTEGIAAALNEAHKGDTVLLAGKGHETYQIIGTAKNHYDEREIVKGLLNGSIKA
jgi:UDP-N-acetylmuramoyl-L-alanyl-D-glutamate--2,6-diaminopimelate ligase